MFKNIMKHRAFAPEEQKPPFFKNVKDFQKSKLEFQLNF